MSYGRHNDDPQAQAATIADLEAKLDAAERHIQAHRDIILEEREASAKEMGRLLDAAEAAEQRERALREALRTIHCPDDSLVWGKGGACAVCCDVSDEFRFPCPTRRLVDGESLLIKGREP